MQLLAQWESAEINWASMKSSISPPTLAEQRRIEDMRHMGCRACLAVGIKNTRELELHHILLGGQRMSQLHTMFLCRGHHQGQWSDYQRKNLDPKYFVSIAHGRKSFCKVFGSERELWEQLQACLGQDCPWPTSKILPRRVAKDVQLPIPDPIEDDAYV